MAARRWGRSRPISRIRCDGCQAIVTGCSPLLGSGRRLAPGQRVAKKGIELSVEFVYNEGHFTFAFVPLSGRCASDAPAGSGTKADSLHSIRNASRSDHRQFGQVSAARRFTRYEKRPARWFKGLSAIPSRILTMHKKWGRASPRSTADWRRCGRSFRRRSSVFGGRRSRWIVHAPARKTGRARCGVPVRRRTARSRRSATRARLRHQPRNGRSEDRKDSLSGRKPA